MGKAAFFPNWASISHVQRDAMLCVCGRRKKSAPPLPPGMEVLNQGLQEIIFLVVLIQIGCRRHCLLLEKLFFLIAPALHIIPDYRGLSEVSVAESCRSGAWALRAN